MIHSIHSRARRFARHLRWALVDLLSILCALNLWVCWMGGSTAFAVDLQDAELTESSGLAFSNRSPGRVWTHNDSGDTARLFAFDSETGRRTGGCRLANAESKDWESLAGFVDAQGKARLIIADSGDNNARRESFQLHLLDEPNPNQETIIDSGQYVTIRVRHADGPVDCEAVAVHIPTQSLILISKGKFPVARVEAISLKAFETPSKLVTTTPLARLPFPMITGMDIDPKSGSIWLSSYFTLLQFPLKDQPTKDLPPVMNHDGLIRQLRSDPIFQTVPSVRQLEAIACDAKGQAWISSEGHPAKLLPLNIDEGPSNGKEQP